MPEGAAAAVGDVIGVIDENGVAPAAGAKPAGREVSENVSETETSRTGGTCDAIREAGAR